MDMMKQQLQDLLDRDAIERQIKRYAHIIDHKEFDKLYDVMVPGAWIDYTATGGEKGTVEEMEKSLEQSMAIFRSQHLMTNVEVDIAEDRKSAKSTHLLFNPMTMKKRGRDYTFFCGVRYDCDWVPTEGGIWKISRMIQWDGYSYWPSVPPKS